MDINSVEFYTIAFVVAMALIALLMGRVEKKPASTYIAQLGTEDDDNADAEDRLIIEPLDGGKVRIARTGLLLGPEETINLVFTIRDEECSIVEKKGVKRRGAAGEPTRGEVIVKWLRYGTKYHIRYESQITSTWATFTFDTTANKTKQVELKF